MIHPSYVELMKVVNKDAIVGEEPVINSRYSIVCATAKRARQIIDGRDPLVTNTRGKKPLSIAVEELNSGVLKILTEDEVRNEREKQAAYDEKVREEKAKRREEEKQKNEAKKSDRGRSLDSLDEEEEYEGDETVPGDAEEADNAPSDEE
ncbi:MAG: DNA-directed RNA polymerase subunit omega [Lachnospiraceae bacterium]|nr:DNA-directed RNA polymerase subunit omega [Lachnospiraceae bacterium]MBQ6259465.1 DNA-directed RNA polymerase subunit omega [Lachnospiraceae bacterium]